MAQAARHRVVVTGVGPITSIGSGKDAFWGAILAGRSGTRAIDLPWLSSRFRCRVGAPVDLPDLAPWGIGEQDARLLDPATRLALGATWMALEDAGLRPRLADDDTGRIALDGGRSRARRRHPRQRDRRDLHARAGPPQLDPRGAD